MSESLKAAAMHAVDVLNRIHTADPTVLSSLIRYRVPCNEAVASDLTVQVGKRTFGDGCEVGLLGVVNGIFGINDVSYGFIAAKCDSEGQLLGFEFSEDFGKPAK